MKFKIGDKVKVDDVKMTIIGYAKERQGIKYYWLKNNFLPVSEKDMTKVKK